MSPKPIFTKFCQDTRKRSASYCASYYDGDKWTGSEYVSATLGTDKVCHELAVRKLCNKMGWTGHLVCIGFGINERTVSCQWIWRPADSVVGGLTIEGGIQETNEKGGRATVRCFPEEV